MHFSLQTDLPQACMRCQVQDFFGVNRTDWHNQAELIPLYRGIYKPVGIVNFVAAFTSKYVDKSGEI